MNKFLSVLSAFATVFVLSSSPAMAKNTPCSGKKGGISHCSNGKFVCKDRSISASKKVCK